MRTFGVEEELLIVDPATGVPLPLADAMMRGLAPEAAGAGYSFELKLEQIETQTAPCLDHDDLLRQIRQRRSLADRAARAHGARVAALATSPLSTVTHNTPDPRYAAMQERFGVTVADQLTCGLHVHTLIDSPEEGVAVLDRIRDKLAVLAALSANSPFWNGAATGFESYRTQVWGRCPGSGPAMIFGSYPGYQRMVARLLDSGVLFDEGMVYFDARLARNHPTVEVRVADVCLRAEDAALIAVLVRALVESASWGWRAAASNGCWPSAPVRSCNGGRSSPVRPTPAWPPSLPVPCRLPRAALTPRRARSAAPHRPGRSWTCSRAWCVRVLRSARSPVRVGPWRKPVATVLGAETLVRIRVVPTRASRQDSRFY